MREAGAREVTMQAKPLIRALLMTAGAVLVTVPAGADEPSATPSTDEPTKPTPIVIDAKTLEKYSDQGNVTEVGKARSKPKGTTSLVDAVRGGGDPSNTMDGSLVGESQLEQEERRRYWRSRYERQLDLVASLEEQIEVLDNEIPGLWRDFYAWDDPMYRDGVIKPKLDEALTRRQSLEEKLGEERERLPKIKEGARRDGATPGWFRGLDSPKPEGQQPKARDDSILATELDDVGVVSADDTSP
jgi:hypothetical protein